jgi:hypothetical protein
MPTDFDSEGNILPTTTFLTHPDIMPTYKSAIEEIENDPELQSRHRANIAKQYNEWVDRENRRNWLTSASERSFQIPFCQLLSAQGERLLYIASHGQFEKARM